MSDRRFASIDNPRQQTSTNIRKEGRKEGRTEGWKEGRTEGRKGGSDICAIFLTERISHSGAQPGFSLIRTKDLRY